MPYFIAKQTTMTMIRKAHIILFAFLIGCGPSRQEQARERLEEVLVLKESGNFNLAKLKLDTLIKAFSDQTEQVGVARQVLKEISILEQERNLVFLDSMLKVQEEILEPMMKNFIASDEYGPQKILIHKRQRPENSFNRTFLRAHLNEAGDFFISSRYYGSQWIYHQQIKVYNQDQSVFSEIVPEDGFDNRRFDDQGEKWEIVQFKDGKDNGIIDYIATHWKDPLKVQLIGKRHVYIVMELFDKEAIRDGYEISFVLKEVHRIKEEKKKVNQMLRQLKS